MRTLNLIDGVKRAANHPDTFEVPTLAEKEAVIPGDFVKIGWEDPDVMPGQPNGERMWVEVTGEYIGILRNNPVVFQDALTLGQEVKFHSDNILSIKEWR